MTGRHVKSASKVMEVLAEEYATLLDEGWKQKGGTITFDKLETVVRVWLARK